MLLNTDFLLFIVQVQCTLVVWRFAVLHLRQYPRYMVVVFLTPGTFPMR
jgi:hypothetical protein